MEVLRQLRSRMMDQLTWKMPHAKLTATPAFHFPPQRRAPPCQSPQRQCRHITAEPSIQRMYHQMSGELKPYKYLKHLQSCKLLKCNKTVHGTERCIMFTYIILSCLALCQILLLELIFLSSSDSSKYLIRCEGFKVINQHKQVQLCYKLNILPVS